MHIIYDSRQTQFEDPSLQYFPIYAINHCSFAKDAHHVYLTKAKRYWLNIVVKLST